MTSGPIVVDETYTAPVERVWNAIVDPRQMPKWFFPTIERFEARVGFEARFTVESQGRQYVHLWEVTEVVPHQRIAYRWRYEGIPGESLVVWEIVSTTKGTRLTLRHSGIESFPKDDPAFQRETGVAGWTYFLSESLRSFLEQHGGSGAGRWGGERGNEGAIALKTSLVINAPAKRVYEAIVDPKQMAHYFITTGSARMDEAKTVVWTWADHGDARITVEVRETVPGKTVAFAWKPGERTIEVRFTLEPIEDGKTDVRIAAGTWLRDAAGIAAYGEEMGGWVHMLTCLKAHLEHGINLRR